MSRYKRMIFGIGERLHGWDVIKKLHRLEEMEDWDRSQIELFQLEQLQKLTTHAYQNVPFYKDLWDRYNVHPDKIYSLEDLACFPKVTKKMLVEAGDRTLDKTQAKGSFVEGRSSGSTGEQFVYYKTISHQSWFIAGQFHGWKWAGWNIGEPWIRLQFRGNIGLRAKMEDRIFNCLYMPIDELSNDYLHKFVPKAIRFNPTMLRGYAGGTYVLSQFLLKNSAYTLSPKVVVCTGDTLYPHYRKSIESAFNCAVFDTYGGEGMSIANQCRKGSYHIVPVVYLEHEPEGPKLENSQPGRLLVTNLTNFAMPLIKYDIGDIGIMGQGTCACGREWKYLKEIVGRETDIIVTPEGRYLVCHHFNNILRQFEGIEQFQIIQNDLRSITVNMVVNEKYEKDGSEPIIKKQLYIIGGREIDVILNYVDLILAPKSGKRRYIISKVGTGASE